MTTDALALAAQTAADRLKKSSGMSSLDALVQAKTRRSLLLVDCSGSMADYIRGGERKIDALRKVVATLRAERSVPVAAFGLRGSVQVEVVETVPEPSGTTPMDLAIRFGQDQGANHLAIVTDGEPNDEVAAFEAARAFGGVIDTFYVGDGNDRGSRFAQQLATMTGGTANLSDLGTPHVLAGKIRLALGDGSQTI